MDKDIKIGDIRTINKDVDIQHLGSQEFLIVLGKDQEFWMVSAFRHYGDHYGGATSIELTTDEIIRNSTHKATIDDALR